MTATPAPALSDTEAACAATFDAAEYPGEVREAAVIEEVARDRELHAQGICPRSGQRLMPNGVLRPACSFCDCGEPDERALAPQAGEQHHVCGAICALRSETHR